MPETASIIDPAIQPFTSKSYRKNAHKAEDKGYPPCPCCGKAIKRSNGAETLYVEVIYVTLDPAKPRSFECGYRAAEGRAHLTGPLSDTQGWWAVGSACARKLRAAGADVRNLEPLPFG